MEDQRKGIPKEIAMRVATMWDGAPEKRENEGTVTLKLKRLA